MSASADEKALKKENERLRKENALQRELIEVPRELPGNRGRGVPTPPAQAAKEAEATTPRKKKSKPERRSVPGAAAVDSPPTP